MDNTPPPDSPVTPYEDPGTFGYAWPEDSGPENNHGIGLEDDCEEIDIRGRLYRPELSWYSTPNRICDTQLKEFRKPMDDPQAAHLTRM